MARSSASSVPGLAGSQRSAFADVFDKRGSITGLAVAGFGAGALITAPIATRLIASVGVMQTFAILGAAYFVAVTGPDQTILSKRTLPVHIDIPPDGRRAGITDHIEELIPAGSAPANQLNIMLGFQQGPEVVDFYRLFRGR